VTLGIKVLFVVKEIEGAEPMGASSGEGSGGAAGEAGQAP